MPPTTLEAGRKWWSGGWSAAPGIPRDETGTTTGEVREGLSDPPMMLSMEKGARPCCCCCCWRAGEEPALCAGDDEEEEDDVVEQDAPPGPWSGA